MLGERLAGAWLFGSGALGDFDAARSDLDVQAVTTVPVARSERERLAVGLSHEALPCPVRGLELGALRARDWHAAGPAFQLNLDTGPRMDRHVAFDPADDPAFWFVLDVAIGREAGRALTGPPAAEVFPPLPRGLVLAALREALAWHRDNDPTGRAGGARRVPRLGVGGGRPLAAEGRGGSGGRWRGWRTRRSVVAALARPGGSRRAGARGGRGGRRRRARRRRARRRLSGRGVRARAGR